MTPTEITFPSGGAHCSALHFTGQGDDFADGGRRPCVVMAAGFPATRDKGLENFATRLSEAGLDVLAFDYRGCGAGGGAPRQRADLPGQRRDFAAALAAASGLPDVDPARLVLWGASLGGGHVLCVAADRTDVAAAVALTPALDGLATVRGVLAADPRGAGVATVAGLRDRVAGWRRGEFTARALIDIARDRPIRCAAQVRAPMLVQVADEDRTAPPRTAMKAAWKARADVRHYPCDHLDVLPGAAWFDLVVGHQVGFLRRVVGARAETSTR